MVQIQLWLMLTPPILDELSQVLQQLCLIQLFSAQLALTRVLPTQLLPWVLMTVRMMKQLLQVKLRQLLLPQLPQLLAAAALGAALDMT